MISQSQQVLDGITRFIKLIPLREDPKHEKWVRDEFDLKEAIEILGSCVSDTQRMIGRPIYVGESTFDFAEDVKRGVEENLLGSRDPADVLIRRKYNVTMYHLVVEPIIEYLATINHQTVLDNIQEYVDMTIRDLWDNLTESHFDDAVVARAMTAADVRLRSDIRKEQKHSRRTKKKVLPIVIDDVVEDDDL